VRFDERSLRAVARDDSHDIGMYFAARSVLASRQFVSLASQPPAVSHCRDGRLWLFQSLLQLFCSFGFFPRMRRIPSLVHPAVHHFPLT
jgi:hypothetical protein